MSSGFIYATPEGALCCVCLQWYPLADLAETDDGKHWDVCKTCMGREDL